MMSIQLGALISQILFDYFGDIVQKVGSDLFKFGTKPISLIVKSTELPRKQVFQSLRALIKYGLVSFESSKNGITTEYTVNTENILSLLRYPRYLLVIKHRYGNQAEMIVEEILQEGSSTASQIIINIMMKLKDNNESAVSVIGLRDTITSLVTAGYIQYSPPPIEDICDGDESVRQPNPTSTMLPEVDIRTLTLITNGDETATVNDVVFWKVNLDRFHQDFRDELLITGMTRCIDDSGGELMRNLLQQMYLRTDPWEVCSNPIPLVELRESCKRSATEYPLLVQYLEQYLKVMEDSSEGVVMKSGGAGGGQYELKTARASELLVWDLLFSTVQERLGTKAARIFRLIKEKKYIEEEDIQRNAMLPAKEAKQYTYRLLEEHFIDVQVLRKVASGNAGPSKAFYLYHIDLNHVSNMVLEMTYKALYNAVMRKEHEKFTNKRMIEKQQRVDTIVHGMRMRGEPEDNIQDIEETVTPPEKIVLERIKTMITKLSSAEIQLDETMFILQMFFVYRNKQSVVTKTGRGSKK